MVHELTSSKRMIGETFRLRLYFKAQGKDIPFIIVNLALFTISRDCHHHEPQVKVQWVVKVDFSCAAKFGLS